MKKLIITFLLCGWAINLYALPPFFSYGGGGTVTGEVNVSDDAYNSTTWNNDALNAPSRNAVRDKFESLDGDYQPLDTDLTDLATGSPTGTYDLSGATITFGLEASDIPDISETYQTADAVLAALAALANGSGVLTNDGSGGLSWGAGGGSMVYPSTGIPVSTGSAWGTSITDNSANWNTAYGWGDHSAAGYQASDSSLTNIASNWTVDSSGNVSGIGTIEPTPTTHPQAVLYDSDAPGETIEEKAMAYLWGEYKDGADDAENSSAGIAARAAGAWFDWIWYDKTVDQVKVTRDLDVDGDVTADNFGDGATPVRIVYDPTPATDATVSGDLISVVTTTGLNAVAGDLVYVANTGGTDGPIVALADADHADKVGAVFLITESISAENAGKALISGIMRLDSWDWSGANKSLYISATAGDMTETIPSTAGQYVQKIGYSLTPDIILFRPSVDFAEAQ